MKHVLRSPAPSSFDPGTLAEAVDAELSERIEDLENAISDLDETARQPEDLHRRHASRRRRRDEGELHAVLMLEDLDHARLPGNDAEIIDSALRLRPYTADVAVATYDRSMLFRARNAGLKAFKPDLVVR